MPTGLRRFHHSGHSHFITFTCYHRFCNLNSNHRRDAVVNALENARVRYDFRVYGFVVMPDHVHLLISEPERGTVANAIQSLKISSSKRCAAHGAAEMRLPFWQKRYYDRNTRD